MWKTVLAGTTVLAIAGATLAYAHPNPMQHAKRWRPNAADITAFADARIAALHAGLQLTPEQEKNWPALANAMKAVAQQRSDWFAARASAHKPKTPIDRLALRAQRMSDRGAALKKLADAAGPLYDSLNPDQKHRFMVLARVGGGFGMAHWRARHGWRADRRGWHRRPGRPAPRPQ